MGTDTRKDTVCEQTHRPESRSADQLRPTRKKSIDIRHHSSRRGDPSCLHFIVFDDAMAAKLEMESKLNNFTGIFSTKDICRSADPWVLNSHFT
jgi:hypothetical protein